MATLVLSIEGLDAGDDERLERALRDLPGVFGVVVSVVAGRGELDIEDDEVSLDTILERVRQEGFEVRLG